MSTVPDLPPAQRLEQLLHRDDIWQGNSPPTPARAGLSTGYANLDSALLHRGWPLGALTEICQPGYQGEWQLFLPALRTLENGLIVLLNPPAEPFCQAMIQAGLDLDRLVVVGNADKREFMASFRELARSTCCAAILGWQPADGLSYTDLRKCLLAATDGGALCTLFRPSAAQRQSSPAPLRVFGKAIPAGLEVTVFKQTGMLQRSWPRPLLLPLPECWQQQPPHRELAGSGGAGRTIGKAPVVTFRGGR